MVADAWTLLAELVSLLTVAFMLGLAAQRLRQDVIIGHLLAGVLLGEVHMAGGMFVHEISVLVVILNGMRLLRGDGTVRNPERAPAPDLRASHRQTADA